MWRASLLVLGGMLLWTAHAEAAMEIAVKRQARCVIVAQNGATPTEKHAAEELASTLKKVTGADFSIVPESSVQESTSAIIVGPGNLARKYFPAAVTEAFRGEETLLRSWDNKLLITGGRPRGTLYAVYRFLHRVCGVRWWTPWASTFPDHPTLTVDALNIGEKPAFESRDPFWYLAFNAEWAAHNLSNSRNAHLTEQQGGAVEYKGFVHTFYPLIPPEEHFKVHPEWFSLNKEGQRFVEGGQLCTTNPQLRDKIVERAREWLHESPDASILSVSQNDNFGPCLCPICKAIDDREGSYSGTMLDLANYVAARIAPEYPQVAIDTLAYQYTRKAPKTLSALPNVIVRLCSIECNFAAPLEDPSNRSFADDIRAWSQHSQRLYIWDYVTNFAHYIQPHPNWFVLGPNVRFFRRYGVRGLFEQGAYQSNGGEMAELRAWLLAQLLWNPDQDDKKLIREFLDGYYGKPSARFIRQYMNLMQTAAKGYYMGVGSSTTAPFLKFSVLSKAEKLWQQAEEAAKDSPDLLWRVRQGHLPVRYVWLSQWTSLRRDCLRAGAEWPLPLSRKAVADVWLQEAVGPGPVGWFPITHLNEGGLTPQQFVARFAQDEPDPPITPASMLPARSKMPSPPAGLVLSSPALCVDAQDEKARLYNEGVLSEIRGDQAASDGLAAWMPGDHHEWAFQMPVSTLTPRLRKGRWKVYVIARVEKKAGGALTGDAFTAGIYDAGGHVGTVSISAPVSGASETYKPYLLGTFTLKPEEYVWVAPAANPSVAAIWVDRIYFVPEK